MATPRGFVAEGCQDVHEGLHGNPAGTRQFE
jgi:hypothetical protein